MNKETQSESFVDGFIRKYEGIIKNSVYNPNSFKVNCLVNIVVNTSVFALG